MCAQEGAPAWLCRLFSRAHPSPSSRLRRRVSSPSQPLLLLLRACDIMRDGDDDGPVDVHKFFEQEAEEDDEGSSDDEEAEGDDDVYEGMEAADNEDVGDESRQRQRIAKVFHKQQVSEDRRTILMMRQMMGSKYDKVLHEQRSNEDRRAILKTRQKMKGKNDAEPSGSQEEEEDDEDDDGPVDVRKFFEQEAELSGDEASSDEEEAEGDNEYEGMEEADNDDVGDESEQRETIAKVFHKQQADEDRRAILMMQNKMFEDGDLHMNGKMRQRKFRWRNVKHGAWIDPNDRSSDEEENEDCFAMPLCSDEVIVNYKKDFPEEYADQEMAGGKAAEEPREPLKTIPAPAFGGNAGSILSYIVRDKRTCELLSSIKQSSPKYEQFMKKTVKKHKIRSRTIFH